MSCETLMAGVAAVRGQSAMLKSRSDTDLEQDLEAELAVARFWIGQQGIQYCLFFGYSRVAALKIRKHDWHLGTLWAL